MRRWCHHLPCTPAPVRAAIIAAVHSWWRANISCAHLLRLVGARAPSGILEESQQSWWGCVWLLQCVSRVCLHWSVWALNCVCLFGLWDKCGPVGLYWMQRSWVAMVCMGLSEVVLGLPRLRAVYSQTVFGLVCQQSVFFILSLISHFSFICLWHSAFFFVPFLISHFSFLCLKQEKISWAEMCDETGWI